MLDADGKIEDSTKSVRVRYCEETPDEPKDGDLIQDDGIFKLYYGDEWLSDGSYIDDAINSALSVVGEQYLPLSGGTMTGSLKVYPGRPDWENFIEVGHDANHVVGLTLWSLYKCTGNNTYHLEIPSKNGTLALTSDIPEVPVKSVKRNNTALTPDANGAVNIVVPTKASDISAVSLSGGIIDGTITLNAYQSPFEPIRFGQMGITYGHSNELSDVVWPWNNFGGVTAFAVATSYGHNGNLAALDEKGNPIDSGIAKTNVVTCAEVEAGFTEWKFNKPGIYTIMETEQIVVLPTDKRWEYVLLDANSHYLGSRYVDDRQVFIDWSSDVSGLTSSRIRIPTMADLDGKVSTSLTVNGKALSSDVTLYATDITYNSSLATPVSIILDRLDQDIDQLNSEKAPKVSPAFTGTPTAPTQLSSDNSTKIATTAFVKNGLDLKAEPYPFINPSYGGHGDVEEFTLIPFVNNYADFTTPYYSGVTDFTVLISPAPVANTMRDLWFVIKVGNTAPTITWNSAIDKFDGGSAAELAPDANETNIYHIVEYTRGHFALSKFGYTNKILGDIRSALATINGSGQ